ncbi:MAG: MFS transporter [Ktedonobacterales bacterium]
MSAGAGAEARRTTRGGRRQVWPVNSRWNFMTLGADIAFFSLGLSISSAYTLLPLFAHHLTDNNLLIALIPALRALGQFAPQLLVAPFVERRRRTLPMILVITPMERVPFLLLALGALWLAQGAPALLLGMFLFLVFLATLGSGLVYPAWLDLIARAIPSDWLGRFLGFWSGLGGALGIGGAAIGAALIATFSFPLNFALCFLLTFAAMIVSFVLLALGREPTRDLATQATHTARPPHADAQHADAQEAHTTAPAALSAVAIRWNAAIRRFLAQNLNSWRLLGQDRGLLRLIIASGLLGIATMASALFAVSAIKVGGLSDPEVGVESTVLAIALTGGNFLWGYVGDRWGHRAVLMWGALCAGASAALALWASGFWDYALIFALLGLNLAATQLAQLTYIAEFGPPERRPTYIALASVAYAPFAIGAPLLGGWFANLWGYTPVYALSALVGFGAAIAFQFWVPNSRRAHSSQSSQTSAASH